MSRPTIDAAATHPPLTGGRGVPCNPDTLGDPCVGGCGRQLHTAPSSRIQNRSRRICDRGHPINLARGLCPGCHSRARRTAAGVPPRPAAPRTPPVNPYSYCTHDEGEHCSCEVGA